MKKIMIGTVAAAFAATTIAIAGDLSEPVITEVQDEPAASSAPWLPIV